MGELRKKMGLGFFKSMNFVLTIILSFGLASSIQYGIYTKVIKTDTDMPIQYMVYFLYLLSLIFVVVYYIKRKISIPISLYEKGVILKRSKKTIMYDEILTFYFIPTVDKKIKYLIVEGEDQEKVIFSTSYVGEDFLDYFQKDYMIANTDKYIEKLDLGNQIKFGIMSKKQIFMLKFFKGKKSLKNLKFEDEMIISKNEFIYRENIYKWEDINTQYDISTSNITIKDSNGDEILSTYFSCVEKGSFAFNLIDYIMDNYNKFESIVSDEFIGEFDDSIMENEIDERKNPEFNKAKDEDYNKDVEINYQNILAPYTIEGDNIEADNITQDYDISSKEIENSSDAGIVKDIKEDETAYLEKDFKDDIDMSNTDIVTAIKLDKDKKDS